MWEHLLASILLETSGFHLENNYEETLNQYFLQHPEDEFLLELEYASSDLEKSLHMLKKDCACYLKKYNRHKFASIICGELEEIYNNTAIKEFVSCAYKLWQMLPICQHEPPLSDLGYFDKPLSKKDMTRADAAYREMFRYYADGLDRDAVDGISLGIPQFAAITPGSIEPDFEKAEMLLGFRLNKSVRNFYSRVFAKKIDGVMEKRSYRLFPCTNLKSSARFIRDHFYMWTGGNDFGERVLIGDFSTGIGQILIVINNETDVVEWVDCGYGHYTKYAKNPNGILAENIDQFLNHKWEE